MAMHPTNEFIYAADQNDSDVLGFDTGDGSFSGLIFERNSDAPAINAPRVEALTPHGGYLYATNSGGTAAEVSEYVIDLKTGALTSNGTAPCGHPVGVAVEPSELYAYVVNLFDQTVSQYTLHPPGKLVTNGTLNLPFNESSTPELIATTLPLAEAESTECAYVTDDGLGVLHQFTIDLVTGALTQLPDVSADSLPFGIAIHPTGRFIYTASAKSNSISVFSQTSATDVTACTAPLTSQVTSSLAVVTNLSGPISIAVEPTGQFAYTANSSNGTVGKSVRERDQHDNRSANPNRRSQHRNSAKPRQPANFRGNDVLEGWPDQTQSRSRKRAANPCQTVADSIRISASRRRSTVRRVPVPRSLRRCRDLPCRRSARRAPAARVDRASARSAPALARIPPAPRFSCNSSGRSRQPGGERL